MTHFNANVSLTLQSNTFLMILISYKFNFKIGNTTMLEVPDFIFLRKPAEL